MVPQRHPRHYAAIALTIALFAVWGFANRITGQVSPQFNRFFALDGFAAFLSSYAVGLSYMFLAIPAAMFLHRFSYKLGLVAGLAAFSAGALLLYPAVAAHSLFFYAIAMVATGSGWAFLETSANSLMLRIGSPENALQRLNLAQSFYPAGLLAAYLAGGNFAVPAGRVMDAPLLESIVRPYIVVGLAVLLIAFLVDHVEFPKAATEHSSRDTSMRSEIRHLLARPAFRFALVTMAVYMTGLILLWGSTRPYVSHVLPGLPAASLVQVSVLVWIVCGLGRAIGTAAMSRISPQRLLAGFGVAAVSCISFASSSHALAGVACLMAASFFIGIMFPTIFGTGVGDDAALTKTASGLMVTAAGCGMVAGMLTNWWLSVNGNLQLTLSTAAAAFIVVVAFALYSLRQDARLYAHRVAAE